MSIPLAARRPASSMARAVGIGPAAQQIIGEGQRTVLRAWLGVDAGEDLGDVVLEHGGEIDLFAAGRVCGHVRGRANGSASAGSKEMGRDQAQSPSCMLAKTVWKPGDVDAAIGRARVAGRRSAPRVTPCGSSRVADAVAGCAGVVGRVAVPLDGDPVGAGGGELNVSSGAPTARVEGAVDARLPLSHDGKAGGARGKGERERGRPW